MKATRNKTKSVRKAKGQAAAQRQATIALNPKAKVKMTQPGYPTIQKSMEQSSLMLAAPTNKTYVQRTGMPKLQYRPNGDCQIKHREFLQDVAGSVDYACTPLSINPGVSSIAPWLSRIACNFESYNFRTLRFAFETEASTAATGSVILAVDYDPSDPAPTTKMQALSFRATVRSAPWAPCVHESLAEDLSKRKTYYTRQGALAPGEDAKLFDIGKLHVITQGMATNAIVGELWIEYDVILMTPKTSSAAGGNAIWGSWRATSNSNTAITGGNLPATFVHVGGATSFNTWTFTAPWSGVFSATVTGVNVALTGVQITGTATVGVEQFLTNGTNTAGTGYVRIQAMPGSILGCNPTNTSIDTFDMFFTQGFGAQD